MKKSSRRTDRNESSAKKPQTRKDFQRARQPTPVHEIIGNRIRRFRIAKGLSQEELARRLGLSFQQIQKYEKGTNRVDAARLVQIARTLEADILEFYGEAVDQRAASTPAASDLYLATSECNRMLEALINIKSAPLRQQIVSFAEVIAEKSSGRQKDDECQ
ncbi:helix-turn-helix transcriptional regulator [Bradyrhizobium sp. 83012]|uniref:Helix-turn-helix transcriptional regulator n=1 Tax=Bradyrhizobium aeschynomenes TaxID=2734909 RepID=A0ABX2CNB9_9BRAD|nr:helix-turn-helix transcriptional regulator [Bradyrhizobium aeschynomenes]NPU15639.1 helix-turn-helix transcriptional regulator [Bradyrhizobium aeschynomenes]NPU69696.1 helix-turn-helix transcriptional regulator [Bradyrhizobium aeschynomenes]NPV24637.1 helix-turn-helix transcriptional regulator [Bradyrhizobium aeschynomenes]